MRIYIFYRIPPFYRRFHCKNSLKNDGFKNKMLISQKMNFFINFYRHFGVIFVKNFVQQFPEILRNVG